MNELNPEGHLVKKMARNAFFKAIGEVVIRLLSFAFIVMVARVLGDEKFGVINFAYSFALLFVVIVDFGLNPLMVRDTAKDPGKSAQLFFNLLIIKSVLALLFIIALLTGLWSVAPNAEMIKVTCWLAAFVMLNSFTEFLCAVFHGHQKMQFEALAMTVQKSTLLLAGLAAVTIGWGLAGVAAAYALAGIVGLITAVVLIIKGRFLQGAWKIDKGFMQNAFKQALPLTLTTLFINLYFRIDMTILTKISGAQQAGWYGAAHKCIEVLMVIPAVLVVATFPGFSKLYHENKERMARAAAKICRLLLMLGLPIALGASLIGVPLMILIFGQEYKESGYALGYLSFALCLIFLNYPLSYMLISAEKQMVNAIVSGLAVIVSIVSNLLLIPRYHYLGAAMSAVITELFLFIAYYWMVNRLLFKLKWLKSVIKIIAATLLMGIVVWFVKALPIVVVVAIGGLSYLLALWLLKAIEEEDIQLFLKVIKK